MHRTLTALALALSLGFSSPSSLFDPLWSRLSSFWHGAESPPQPRWQQKEGCGMDPNGRCLPALLDHADEGGGCDPDGRCKPGS
jgi:hypothetical protein